MKKPREFWLDYEAEQIGLQAVNGGRSKIGLTHVIEYQAYQDLEKLAREMKDALEFVSMPINNPERVTIESLLETMRNDEKRAKEALKSFAAWEGGE